MVVSNICYVHPDNWGNDPILTSIFFNWVWFKPPTSIDFETIIFWEVFMSQNFSNGGDYLAQSHHFESTFTAWIFHQTFQVPKMEVLTYISCMFFGLCNRNPTPKIAGYKVLSYLHFRYLKHLVNIGVTQVGKIKHDFFVVSWPDSCSQQRRTPTCVSVHHVGVLSLLKDKEL